MVYIAPFVTTEFVLESDLKYHQKQIWSDKYVIVPIQTTILSTQLNWKQYDLHTLNAVEVLKEQALLFLHDHKAYYGRKAMVSDPTKLEENGRIRSRLFNSSRSFAIFPS